MISNDKNGAPVWSAVLLYVWKESIRLLAAAVTGASGAITGAFGPIGATDTLDALFLRPADIADRQAQNDDNDGNSQNIDIIHRLTYGSLRSPS